jgi:hypothetical protein
MKKGKILIAAVIVGLCTAAALSAQGFGPGMMWGFSTGNGPGMMQGQAGPGTPKSSSRNHKQVIVIEKATVKGNLVAAEGRIALKADGKTYYVRGIQSLIGFVDGLKEGASVEIEGGVQKFAAPPTPPGETAESEMLLLHAEKLTLNGKVYDKLASIPGDTTPPPPRDFPPRRR